MDTPVTERLSGDLPVVDADTAAAAVPDAATVMVSGFGGVGYPKAIPLTLAEADRDLALTVITGGGVGDEIDAAMVEGNAISRRYPGQANATMREAINDGRVDFQSRHYGGFSDDIRFGGWVDGGVAIVEAVAVGKDWLIPSAAVGHTPTYMAEADSLIVEVNTAQPLSLQHLHDVVTLEDPPNRRAIELQDPVGRIGEHHIDFDPDKLEAVVQTDHPDSPYTKRDLTDVDKAIAENFVSFIAKEIDRNPLFSDTINFECGVGNIGNALMAALADLDTGDRTLTYFGEIVQDGVLDLLDLPHFRGASATSLSLTSAGLDELLANIEQYADRLILRPTEIANNPALIDRFGVIAVNAALEVDLYGHANSEHIAGTRLVNAIGGSNDFNRSSPLSVVALPSTAGDGDVTRIVPMVPHVDHTEHDVDVVVTEHGVADLRGTVPNERAERLIANCAAPHHRADLRTYRDRAREGGGHEPHDLETAFDQYTNL
ncbi:MAG: acetyl-CoA hydrolase/transferase C-terminal domain-containing protein [Salinirussus sp.]